jgi:hypothetical protein
MGFDIFYQPCRFGKEPIEQKNPFTGEVRMIRPVEPLITDNVRAVRVILQNAPGGGSDEAENYAANFDDGGEVFVLAKALEQGCMVSIHLGLTPDVLRFLFDLLKAADWIMLPVMEGIPAITTIAGRGAAFSDSFPEVVCESPEELGSVLSGGFDSFERYRDQIREMYNGPD